MIYDRRSSRVVADALQERVDFVRGVFGGHQLTVVFVIALAVLATRIDSNMSAELADADEQTEQMHLASTR